MSRVYLASRSDDVAIIPYARPAISDAAASMIAMALEDGALPGGGRFTKACHARLSRAVPGGTPFLTSSCTDALELAALVLDLAPGDEVIMPSWTFPSTANAVALRGAVPVFVDVEPGTLNIDPDRVAEAIGPRTRAIVCVHYAGVACDMARLRDLARSARIALVEDAAQGYGAAWIDGGVETPLGGIGALAAFSFHGTKNISSGEGGALIVNLPELKGAAEIAWDKGTDRQAFARGEVHRYHWCGLGSSFLPSELTAALLAAQLDAADAVTAARRLAWARYASLLTGAVSPDLLRLPRVPAYARHNGHIFFVEVRDEAARDAVMAHLAASGIETRTHYEPLHDSVAGRRFCRVAGPLPVTEAAARRLIRLPIDTMITAPEQARVADVLLAAVRGRT